MERIRIFSPVAERFNILLFFPFAVLVSLDLVLRGQLLSLLGHAIGREMVGYLFFNSTMSFLVSS